MTTDPRIEAVGAYAPRFRVSAEAFEEAWGQFHAAGVESKAVPDADEDALTMGYEAAARALDAADRAGTDVAFLAFASTTPPLAEEDLTARLGGMLSVPSEATRHVFTGSTRAGTRALDAALSAGPWENGGAGDDEGESVGLVVAADCPRGDPDSDEDHAAGAGAAAFVLSASGNAAVRRRAEYATEYPGTRFRRSGSQSVEGLGATGYERQAFTETLAKAVNQLDLGVRDEDGENGAIDAAAVQAPNGKLPYRAAGALGVDTETIRRCATVHELGDTAAASVPLGLATALAAGDERILAASFGSGAGADALLVESDTGDGVAAETALDDAEAVSYAEYLRKRGELTSGPPEGGGAYVSVPSWRRTLDQRHRLLAGRCPECGSLNFPPEGACNSCKTLVDEYDEVELTGEGTVEAATVISQGGAPPEFAEQQAQSGDFAVAVVALEGPREALRASRRSSGEERSDDPRDGGSSASVPAQVVAADPETVEIGDAVETTMRRIYTQEGVTRYGFKVRPQGSN
ncbi:OB-fold domain-containing protein [Halorussus sp. MSC15.2]|uniref:OB-fold domain-containing protein n=1 Tax=Halorussus sp. MSC15.2 TaxID=2283638 RepID=UPI0013CF8055|nr:zinc ribbon domain-containing protein [Halorussus sp. MSC15.2]NEU57169.1 ACP synthase [Halorussus sp. MSC15.2]